MPSEVLKGLSPMLTWLRESGIQAPPGHRDAGGVFAWIDESTRTPSFVYSEITGYFMTIAAHLARFDPEGGWIGRAEAAGDWLLREAKTPEGAILARRYAKPEDGAKDPYSFENKQVLFFDTAMVGYGFVCLHEATKKSRWLDAAVELAAAAHRLFESPDRKTRHAAFDLKRGEPVPSGPRWSAHFASYELKGAMFLASVARYAKRPEDLAMAERILADALSTQQASGRFPTDGTKAATHLHPHSYTLEGLLWLAAREGRRELLDPVARGVDWTFTTCLRPGAYVQQWSEKPDLVIRELRSDTLAQSLRAYHVLKLMRPELSWPWESSLEAQYQKLDSFLLPSGGTVYGQDEYGKKSSHANSWCHFFGLEMRMYRALRETKGEVDLSKLIIC